MPASQTHFPASPRQIRFINVLRQERGLPELDELTASHLTGGRTGSASAAITELQNQPVARPTTTATRGGGTQMPAPSNGRRAGRMLNGGGIDATVTLASGDHVTLLISTRAPRGRGWANGAPGDEGARTNIKVLGSRVGWVNVVDGVWTVTLRTRNENVRQAVHALFEYAATGDTAGGERVQEASRCGRCRRTLTDPVSIDRGIGPECWGRCTGSHHAEVRSTGTDPDYPHGRPETPAEAFARREGELRARIDEDAERLTRDAQERLQGNLETVAEALTTQVAPATQRATQSLSAMAEALAPISREEQRVIEARDLIEAALKAYVEDEMGTDRAAERALATFDRLARGVQS